jgi:hypothetical protein
MSSHKSIRVRRTNINDPLDCVEFESIHSAMRKCKKSFITIKDFSSNNKTVNGYKWEIIKEDNQEQHFEVESQKSSSSTNDSDVELHNVIIEEYIIDPKDLIIEPPLTPRNEINVDDKEYNPYQPHPTCEVSPWEIPFKSENKITHMNGIPIEPIKYIPIEPIKYKRQPCTCVMM